MINKTVFLKMLAVSVLTVIILIALAAVHGVLESRESYREEAVASIAQSYAGSQRLSGLVLVQPYTQVTEDVTIGDKSERQVTQRKIESSYWRHGLRGR